MHTCAVAFRPLACRDTVLRSYKPREIMPHTTITLNTTIIAAIIAAGASVFGAVVTIYLASQNQRRAKEIERVKLDVQRALETFKAEQQLFASQQNALQSYHYDAKKRLYAECEPLFFHLSEAAEFAFQKCRDLTKPSVCFALRPERYNTGAGDGSWMLNRSSELISALYALFTPVAIWRLLKDRLTNVDCSVDKGVYFRYQLARQLYSTFHHDDILASLSPVLQYDPRVSDWRTKRLEFPEKHWWQGLTRGRLDRVIEIFITGDNMAKRLLTFGEFEDVYLTTYESCDRSRQKILGVAANPLYGFTPFERPVFWRSLMVQAHLHHALSESIPNEPEHILKSRDELRKYLTLKNYSTFDWRHGWKDPHDFDDAGTVALEFLTDQLLATQNE
jgi:hypothetical protein